MKQNLFLISLMLMFATMAQAQEPEIQQVVENLIESLNSDPDESTDYQDVLDDLYYYAQNPLPINCATKEELLKLHLLSEMQIDLILEYRSETGAILSLYEMEAIEGIGRDLLEKLSYFINFETDIQQEVKKYGKNDLMARATRAFSSSSEEITNPAYEGSPERFYLRFKHTSSRLEYGLVSEKDPGEAFFSGSNKYGFDYLGGYANFKVGKSNQQLFIGDYHLMFGQGLLAWQGFSMGKSSETTQIFKSALGIRSSSSTDENQFFRGVAGKLKFRKFELIPFISLRLLDSNIDTLDGKPFFGAFQTSGYHRTNSELKGKDALQQIAGGGHLAYSFKNWTFGGSAVFTQFNVEMIRDQTPENQFLPEGKKSISGSIDWKGSIKNVFIFGEAALSANKGKALLSGLMMKPSSNSEFAVVYRNINKTYFSFFSNAFTESSRTNDEQALYMGFKIFVASHFTYYGYIDFFQNKWLKYTTAAPSKGFEMFSQLSFSPSRKTDFYLRYFQEEKGQKIMVDNLKYNQTQKINRLRFNFAHSINDNWSIKSRIEWSSYQEITNENGLLAYQDVAYKPMEKPFSINLRMAWFKTDGYNSRLYAYENDLLYSFSTPALFGNGIRTYLNFKQNLSEKLTVWLKFATTYRFPTPEQILTGDSGTNSELKIQLRYQF